MKTAFAQKKIFKEFDDLIMRYRKSNTNKHDKEYKNTIEIFYFYDWHRTPKEINLILIFRKNGSKNDIIFLSP